MLQISETELRELREKIDNISREVSRLADELAFMNNLLDTPRGLTTHEADTVHTCPSCGGEGYLKFLVTSKSVCEMCHGTGQV